MRKLSYLLSAAAMLWLTGCEQFVDITPTGKKMVEDTEEYYDLIAQPLRSYYDSSYALLTDNAWAKESSILGSEYISYDGINMTFNEDADRTQLSDNNLYANCYNFILRSNIVISLVDSSNGTPELKRLAKAEAKLMRAWDHFIAVNTFAKAYDPSTAATDGGIAIMSEYNLEAVPTKSTVAQVYEFIIRDIEEALPWLEEEPSTIYHPSKAFGYAFAARVYLYHRDWQKAREAAEKALALNDRLIDYIAFEQSGGPTADKSYALTDNPEVLSYAFIGSGSDNMAYCHGMISPELVKLFGENDERLNLFFDTEVNTTNQWSYDAGSGAGLWKSKITYKFFQYMANGMRTAEVYLTLAEAYARQNMVKEAIEVLNKLRVKRIKGDEATLSASGMSQHEAMRHIIDERRKELLFGFNRFWDLKRYNTEPEYAKTITRVFPLVTQGIPQKTYTLKPDSRLYIIPFPLSVREKNPNLTLNTDE